MTRITRREGLLAGLFGGGAIGLRALATGLPAWYLLNPSRATAQDLQTTGITCPILVGGAALTNKFTRTRIAPEYGGLVVYAKDATDPSFQSSEEALNTLKTDLAAVEGSIADDARSANSFPESGPRSE